MHHITIEWVWSPRAPYHHRMGMVTPGIMQIAFRDQLLLHLAYILPLREEAGCCGLQDISLHGGHTHLHRAGLGRPHLSGHQDPRPGGHYVEVPKSLEVAAIVVAAHGEDRVQGTHQRSYGPVVTPYGIPDSNRRNSYQNK